MSLAIVSIISGLALGALGGPAWALIPWGIIGLLVGYFSRDYPQAVINGAMYGFVLAFAFMVSGYNGSASLISRTPFFALLGLLGAVCALIWALFGRLIASKLRPKRS